MGKIYHWASTILLQTALQPLKCISNNIHSLIIFGTIYQMDRLGSSLHHSCQVITTEEVV